LFSQTVKLFDDMMYELTSQASGLSSQNLEIQTTLRNILQVSQGIQKREGPGVVVHICNPAFGRRQESLEFEVILGCIGKHCLKKKKNEFFVVSFLDGAGV
jgi:hypothetical protein